MIGLQHELEELERTDPNVGAAARRYDETVARILSKPGPVQPFVKWAGGKRQLLPVLLPLVPETFGTYHEPFVGGGAVFFALGGRLKEGARIADSNPELINGYTVVRDHVEELVGILDDLRRLYHGERKGDRRAFYEEVRSVAPETMSPVERAARFIFLNRTCFNGLYRVNKSGRFNVPFGDYANPLICDAANLDACSRMLATTFIQEAPFESVLGHAREGDLVYLDPPYLPVSKTSSFTAYAKEGFGLEDHERLRDVARELKSRGAYVILSSAANPEILRLYAEGFEIRRVPARRAINSKGEGRGPVEELVIT